MWDATPFVASHGSSCVRDGSAVVHRVYSFLSPCGTVNVGHAIQIHAFRSGERFAHIVPMAVVGSEISRFDGVEQAKDGGLSAFLVDEARDGAFDGRRPVPLLVFLQTP